MDPWRWEAWSGLMQSVAPSTQKAYRTAMAKFAKFREDAGYGSGWLVSEEEVIHFIVQQRRARVSTQAMRIQLAGIAFFSKAAGFCDPCQAYRVRKILKGWSRQEPKREDTRRPLSYKILCRLTRTLRRICNLHYEVKLFRAAFITSFFGALRLGEVVANAKTDTSGRALQLGDIAIQGTSMTIKIRRSKTGQGGKGVSLAIKGSKVGQLCPIRTLTKFLGVWGSTPGLLFIHQDGSPLTRFMAICRGALRKLGLPHGEFGGHSFRIGAATAAAGSGIPVDSIKAMGRWRSSVYTSYIRPGLLLEGPGTAGCSVSYPRRTAGAGERKRSSGGRTRGEQGANQAMGR
ncbi:integrase/recombinase xerD homolog [Anolis sagrei]|uniref:integrase/recombinase xerD homolog n=1 Tax=Anolis sagrei TaxID=38937 RepID=UPI003520A258